MTSKNLIITVSREHGSGGRQIAQEVARKLKLAYVDSQIIRSATIQLGIPAEELSEFDEKVLPHLDELAQVVNRMQIEAQRDVALSEVLVTDRWPGVTRTRPATATLDPDLERKAAIHQGYHKLVNSLIVELGGKGGAVILGRGAQFILKTRPYTAHVHVHAPLAVRAQRLASLQHISLNQAEADIQQNDEQRAGYTRRYYKADWRDPDLYHLLLNTAHLEMDSAVAAVVALGHSLANQRPHQEVHATYDRLDQDSYSLKEAAQLLWISPDVLRNAAYRGELKVSIVDHQVNRISRTALVEWLRQKSN